MTRKHSWERPLLLAGVLLCGASLAVNRTQANRSANLDQTRNGKFAAPANPVVIHVSVTRRLPNQTLRDASKRKMSLWGGTLNSITYVDNSASWNAKLAQDIAQVQIQVTFTTGSGSVAILSWAGHIASRVDWGFDANGIPNSA